jgi:hypothetical protein
MPFPLQKKTDIPDLLVTSSPQMIKAFKKYGRSITFDLTYNLIKEIQVTTI